MKNANLGELVERLLSDDFEDYLKECSFYNKDDDFLLNLSYYTSDSNGFIEYLRDNEDKKKETIYNNLLKLYPFSQSLIKNIIQAELIKYPDAAFVSVLKTSNGLYNFLNEYKRDLSSNTTKSFNEFNTKIKNLNDEINKNKEEITELKKTRIRNEDLLTEKENLDKEIKSLTLENNRDDLENYNSKLIIQKNELKNKREKYDGLIKDLSKVKKLNKDIEESVKTIKELFDKFPKDAEDLK